MDKNDWKKSIDLFRRARHAVPGGSVTESKKPPSLFAGDDFPAYFEKADGARITDVDGNEYLDFGMALGPVLLGYNHPEVNDAIKTQLEKGTLSTLSSPLVVELAEKIIELVPCAGMVRFLKSGAEAVSAAVKTARAATGRDMVLRCGYQGWHDWCSPGLGVPEAVSSLSVPFEFNDRESFQHAFDAHAENLAAVVMEPVIDGHPEKGFLEFVRETCDRGDAVLVFDEIKTGFRLAIGGAQEYYGVTPDLAVFGKGMANGMPLAALAGREEYMKALENAWVSSTYAGEALSLAASLKTIEIIERDNVCENLWTLGRRMYDGLSLVAEKHENIFEVGGLPLMNFLRFKTGVDESGDAERMFFTELLSRGVLLKRIAYNFICNAHTEEDVDVAVEAAGEAADAAVEKHYSKE